MSLFFDKYAAKIPGIFVYIKRIFLFDLFVNFFYLIMPSLGNSNLLIKQLMTQSPYPLEDGGKKEIQQNLKFLPSFGDTKFLKAHPLEMQIFRCEVNKRTFCIF